MKIKAGDRIRRVRDGITIAPIGFETECIQVFSNGMLAYLGADSTAHSGAFDSWGLISDKKSNSSYEFSAPKMMVDIGLIVSELSFKKPLALVKCEDGSGAVVVSPHVLQKAKICGIPLFEQVTAFGADQWSTVRVAEDWVRKVKRTLWPEDRKPQRIEVFIKEIS